MTDPFALYTAQVLAFRLGAGDGGYACAPVRDAALAPLVRAGRRAGRLTLLGLGSGELLARLERELPPEVALTVLEPRPDQVRRVGLPGGRARLLADASPTALLTLMVLDGTWPGPAQAVNPEVADPQVRLALRALGRLLAAYSPLDPGEAGSASPPADGGADAWPRTHPERPGEDTGGPCAAGPDSGLCLGAILHPDEPDLEGFFAALPACLDRAVVVWDAPAPPTSLPPAPCPVLHLAHPLEADFAAQRNRMLAACRGEWVLVLDGDERVPPALAELLPRLAARTDLAGVAFARHGLRPGDAVRVGYGLWPDLQLRLVRNLPGLRYVRPVHERLEGLAGPVALVAAPAIDHAGDLLKDQAALARKHALFDRAGGQTGRHRQNREFPELPRSFFQTLCPVPRAGLFAATVDLAGLSS